MIITLDTNVVYQALRSSSGASFFIFQLIRAGKCQLALSQPVFSEYEDVLLRPTSLKAFELTRSDITHFLRYIAYVGKKFEPKFLFRPNLKDENDNMFVELAIVSQSNYLITSNTKDYSNAELKFDNFKLATPAEFVQKWRSFYG